MSVSEPVNEWPEEDDLEFAVGLALQEPDPVLGVEALLRGIGARCGQPLLGTKRAVFLVDEHWVLKVPLTWVGESDNECEAEHYAERHNAERHIPIARCRKHYSAPSGTVLLWMERVRPVSLTPSAQRPGWVSLIDCGQVGYSASGDLVAYDL